MTKQELEKAIENCDTVYIYNIDRNGLGEIHEEKLDKTYINVLDALYNDWVFKTKAEAEHYLNHANITRAEELLFLTWEEFKGGEEIIFKGRNGNEYELSYNECLDMIELIGKKGMYWSILQSWKATEENFYKAYDECVRLFKGEE